MEIGNVGDGGKGSLHKGKKGSGKGKDGKGKKGKDKDKPGPKKDEPKCAICWKTTHTTDKCWFNTRQGQGKPQGPCPTGPAGCG